MPCHVNHSSSAFQHGMMAASPWSLSYTSCYNRQPVQVDTSYP
jgi:hypothetical protein